VYGHSDVLVAADPPSSLAVFTPRDVIVDVSADGTTYHFPSRPMQNGGISVFVTTMIFSAATWALYYFGAPIGFPIFFGIITLLCFIGLLDTWLGTADIRVEPTGLSLTKSNGFFASTKTIPRSEIDKVAATFKSSNGKIEQIVEVLTTDGRRLPAGRKFRRKREAEWVAAEVQKRLR
jgi:hypothetical protein